ncbi:NAD(P)H-dependent flavin oxidoreductase [Methylobacterium longum]|uniref:Propionate 3-nitronate monooxygenase n=1 Tax=Methylobacterium longum TaxID=767694 RepID=A0ABT8AZX0_9HYPH|nr:nitronate monooxygenase [Methylobacterium longum]MDN3575110.1 nitronate monooxygenase [Methylobacterium longum]GJE15083.1 Nitronate monooxygenase [Methylobacterium longum]
MSAPLRRAEAFCSRFGLRAPILLAPMASTCPPALSVAVAKAGGLGGCGALMMQPDEIAAWTRTVRAGSNGAFQINTWIPDPAPVRDPDHEARVREFLGRWGPPVPPEAGDAGLPDFEVQCQAILDAGPTVISSIMGLYPPAFVAAMKARSIAWFAAVTTVAEARAAEAAGADAVVAQGAEAGGHRGSFEAGEAERLQVGLFALLPAVADSVSVPVIAAGGIADARGVAAALTLGASAVQIGTGFLRCPEAGLHPAYADALGRASPEDTMLTRAFTGRAARSLATHYVRAAASGDAPSPAPYPVQRALVAAMRAQAQAAGDVQRMQTWAGQSAGLASAEPAGEVVRRCWEGAKALLS